MTNSTGSSSRPWILIKNASGMPLHPFRELISANMEPSCLRTVSRPKAIALRGAQNENSCNHSRVGAGALGYDLAGWSNEGSKTEDTTGSTDLVGCYSTGRA